MMNRLKSLSFRYLLIPGIVFLALPRIFDNSFSAMCICAWLWPFFFLLYFRRCDKWSDILLGFLALMAGCNLRHFAPLGYSIELILLGALYVSAFYLFTFGSFMLDRFILKGRTGFIYTLAFPLSYTVLDIATSLLHSGNLQSIGYTQVWFLPFVQSASVIGGYGIDFLVTWSASSVASCFEASAQKGSGNAHVGRCFLRLLPWGVTMLVLLVLGAIRLSGADEPDAVIRAAYTTGPYLKQDGIEWEDLPYDDNAASFIRSAASAAELDADILILCEEGYTVDYDREQAFRELLRDTAVKYGMYMLVPIEVGPMDEDSLSDNKALLYSPSGELLFEYTKVMLVPLVETGWYSPGTTPPASALINVNGHPVRISCAICFDGEHSEFIAGMHPDTDILINPSWDWPEITCENTTSVMMRGPEYNVACFKPTYGGWSKAVDRFGRTLVETHTDVTGFETVLTAELPIHHSRSIYRYTAPWLSALYCLGLAAFLIFRLIEIRRTRYASKRS